MELVDASVFHEDVEGACNVLASNSSDADEVFQTQLTLCRDAGIESLGIHFLRGRMSFPDQLSRRAFFLRRGRGRGTWRRCVHLVVVIDVVAHLVLGGGGRHFIVCLRLFLINKQGESA